MSSFAQLLGLHIKWRQRAPTNETAPSSTQGALRGMTSPSTTSPTQTNVPAASNSFILPHHKTMNYHCYCEVNEETILQMMMVSSSYK